jgi:hypothetical protein
MMKLMIRDLDDLKLHNQEDQKSSPLVLKPESLPLPHKFWYPVARGHTLGVYASWAKAGPKFKVSLATFTNILTQKLKVTSFW